MDSINVAPLPWIPYAPALSNGSLVLTYALMTSGDSCATNTSVPGCESRISIENNELIKREAMTSRPYLHEMWSLYSYLSIG